MGRCCSKWKGKVVGVVVSVEVGGRIREKGYFRGKPVVR
jgi:hypothetical protein